MGLVQSKIGSEPGSSGAFTGLVDGMERNQVASTFLKLLVASKKEMVDLDQHDNYEEIIVNILWFPYYVRPFHDDYSSK